MDQRFAIVSLGLLGLMSGLLGCDRGLQSGNSPNVLLPVLSASARTTPIEQILAQPEAAHNRTVYLQGQVGHQVPLLEGQAYQLQDATGKIWVVTSSTELIPGDEILIKGVLQYESIPIAGQERGEVYVEEQEQLERTTAATSMVPLNP